jgi:hypothetical protein
MRISIIVLTASIIIKKLMYCRKINDVLDSECSTDNLFESLIYVSK